MEDTGVQHGFEITSINKDYFIIQKISNWNLFRFATDQAKK